MRFLIIVCLLFPSSLVKIFAQQSPSIHQYMMDVIAGNPSPGISVAAVKDGKIIHLSGYGKAIVDENLKMTKTSIMDIGSITKSMTALAIMQLVEKDLVDLEAPVTQYLPWFRTANKDKSDLITIRMLLNNTCGIVNATKSSEGIDAMTNKAMESLVRDLSTFYLELTPGQSYAYSNYGFHIAGLIVSTVSGMDYWDYMKEKIFLPLKMNHTSVIPSEFKKWKVFNGHGYGANKILPYPNKKISTAFLPAGRMTKSNSEDMANYMLMMLNKGKFGDEQIVSAESHKKVVQREINFQGLSTFIGCEGEDWHYGLGWMIGNLDGNELIFHGGSSGTTSSLMLLNPSSNMGVFVLSNLDHSFLNPFNTYSNDMMIGNNILRILEGKSISDFGQTCQIDETINSYDLPKDAIENYIGTYQVNRGGEDLFLQNATLHIYEKDQQLLGNFEKEGQLISSFKVDFINPITAVQRGKYSRPSVFRFLRKANGEIIGCDFGHSQYRKLKILTQGLQQFNYNSFSFQLTEAWDLAYSKNTCVATKGDCRITLVESINLAKSLFENVNHQGISKTVTIHNQSYKEQIINTSANGLNRMHLVLQPISSDQSPTVILSCSSSSFYAESQELFKVFFHPNS